MSAFEEVGICPEIIRAVEEDGWLLPTPIQQEVIPSVLTGRDVCAAAETGSGKTGAFGLPCAQLVHESLRQIGQTSIPEKSAFSASFKPDISDKDPHILFTTDGAEIRNDNTSIWQGVRCFPRISHGKYVFEVTVLNDGLCRVGVSCEGATLDLGCDSKSWGFGSTGKKSFNRTFDPYGRPFGKGDIISCLIDREENSIAWAINGFQQPVAFGLGIKSQPVCPHISGKGFHVAVETENLTHEFPGFKPLAQIPPTDSQAVWSLDKSKRTPALIVLEPTRDLTVQTCKCLSDYSRYLQSPEIKYACCVGGPDARERSRLLKEGVDVVVGTLRQVCELSMKGEINVSRLRFLVLDEADELLKQDDRDFVLKIKTRAERDQGSSKVQMLLFSATLHDPSIREQISKLCRDPLWIDLKGKPQIPDTVHACFLEVSPDLPVPDLSPMTPSMTDGVHANGFTDKASENSQKIKLIKPRLVVALADKLNMTSCLVFCRTNLDCDNMEAYLKTLGGGFKGRVEKGKQSPYSCVVCAGKRDNKERQESLQLLRDGDVRFLICTDVAARGIDIHGLPFLIMMNIPDDISQWFHRVGRVGRADAMGMAITLWSNVPEKVWFHANCSRRGEGCQNTKLVKDGGCCVWYEDAALRERLLEIIGAESVHLVDQHTLDIPTLIQKEVSKDSDLQINMENYKPQKSTRASQLMIYGEQKSAQLSREHADLLPAAQQLSELEISLQNNYLAMLK